MDPNNEIQLIKINKAYLGAGDAIQMASVSDSLNYTPSDLDVKLYRIKSLGFGQYDTLATVTLYDTIVEKDDGLFSTDDNIIYAFEMPNSFYNTNSFYVLEITNTNTDNIVSSQTEIINNFNFESLNPSFEWGLYNGDIDSLPFRTKNIEWTKSTNGEIYQLDLIINYLEDGENESLVWSQPLKEYTSGNMSLRIVASNFLIF